MDENSEILGDSVRTYQILSNIVSNAIKFTLQGSISIIASIEEGKSIPIVMSPNTTENGSPHKGELDKETIPCVFTIHVVDTGIGMNEKEQARIFQRFSQANNRTSKEYGGSGLGLSICKKLAKLMNGTISLKSEKHRGSTFTLQLNCKKVLENSLSLKTAEEDNNDSGICVFGDAASPQSIADRHSLPAPTKKEGDGEGKGESGGEKEKKKEKTRILVAEDNLMNQTLLSRVLSLKGYVVEITSNGEECLTKYKEKQKKDETFYSCVLMDIQMPVMDGLQATDLIRKFEVENNIQPVVIIGLSGNARDEYHQTAIAAGMNEYITKPYHKELLYSVLEKKWNISA